MRRPLTERLLNWLAYAVGTTLGASVAVLLLLIPAYGAQLLADSWRWAALAAALTYLLLAELHLVPRPSGRRYQIPQHELTRRNARLATWFGFRLGLTYLTYLTSLAPLVLVSLLLLGFVDPGLAFGCALVWGLGRAAPVLLRSLSGHYDRALDRSAGALGPVGTTAAVALAVAFLSGTL